MNGDLISRAEAVEMLMEKADCYAYKEAARIAIDCAGAVKNLPTVDAEPVRHGRWKDGPYTYFGTKRYICSECEDDEYWKWRYVTIKENCCPNCGAKMDGGAEE